MFEEACEFHRALRAAGLDSGRSSAEVVLRRSLGRMRLELEQLCVKHGVQRALRERVPTVPSYRRSAVIREN